MLKSSNVCFCVAEQVAATARSIMAGTLPSTSYNKTSWNPVPRRPKRKTKSKIAGTKYKCVSMKGKQKMETFQRKLIVFRYMGPNSPSKFTRKEHRILMRGMLPEIPLDAPEYDVRVEILSVMQSNVEVDLSDCDKFDFEFLDANGKNVSVPNLKPGSTMNCKTLKRLAGNGAVYVRMCKDFEEIDGPSQRSRSPTPEFDTPVESPELPSYMEYLQPAAPPQTPVLPMMSVQSEAPVVPRSQLHPPDIDLTTDTPAIPEAHTLQETASLPQGPTLQEMSSLPQGPTLQEMSSLPQGPIHPVPSMMTVHSEAPVVPQTQSHPPDIDLTSDTPQGQTLPEMPVLPVTHVTPASQLLIDPEAGVESLCEIFLDFTRTQLKILLELCAHDPNKVIDFLQAPPTATRLRKLLKKQKLKKDPNESARLRVESDDTEEDWVHSALAFYKGSKVASDGYVHVYVRGQPGVDTGKLQCSRCCPHKIHVPVCVRTIRYDTVMCFGPLGLLV